MKLGSGIRSQARLSRAGKSTCNIPSPGLGPDGAPYGPDTQGLLKRMAIEGCVKHPIRKESNRRFVEGNDLSLIEDDEHDATGRVFQTERNRNYHKTNQPLPGEIREWLKTLPLKRVGRDLRIDRYILRKGRAGKPIARSTQNKVLLLFRITKRGVNLQEALNAMKLKEIVQLSETR